ncbi:MAG TPA: signal peptide peptidase SppA [bacterium]
MPKKRNDWLLGFFLAAIMVLFILVFASIASRKRVGTETTIPVSSGGARIAAVEMNGAFYSSDRIVKQFKILGEQKSVKAVVLRIDSPGGTVGSAQEIYDAVRRVRDGGKPVVVSMGDVAASGGYYAACGADTIMANPGTTTGSIGVVAEFPSIDGLLDKIGIRINVIKSGRYKDTGSPYRSLTEEDRVYLQSWINDAYDQFVDMITKERELSRQKVLALADGRVFTGRQAKELGLIDLLGTYEDAITLAAKMAGIEGKPTVVKIVTRRGTLLDLLFQESERLSRGVAGARLMYKLL